MGRSLGVVAAGSQQTAQAAAEVLRAGGNACDAAVGACFATQAGEPSLTSLGGGGVMIHKQAASGKFEICDFFVNAPGLGAPEDAELEFFPVELAFGPARQVFYIGRGSAAVPGALPGLCDAQQRWGRLKLAEVVRPACRMLREGVRIDDYQVSCFQLLEPILLHTPENRAIFTLDGEHLMHSGDLYANPALADTLEEMAAASDWRAWHRSVIEPAVLEGFGPHRGGRITREDLGRYRVEYRQPLELQHARGRILLNPPPSAGGRLIALMLSLIEKGAGLRSASWGSARHLRAMRAAMQVAEESRVRTDLGPELLRERFSALLGSPAPGDLARRPGGHGSTTHVSVIDADGGGAAVTLSHGEANGYQIGQTGITMNNEMGETDLLPGGFETWRAGARLATMMCPSAVETLDGSLSLLGTGGSSRIRTSIFQVIVNLLELGLSPEQAVCAGRIHWESGVLNAETFDLPGGTAGLEPIAVAGEKRVLFDSAHLFFGGVHLAHRGADGQLGGAGDPRRSGVLQIVTD
ncbi:MAG: gamma-glutamyltransferase [Deltaproteobacteria bacterium]|nr:gamma-glutamyltransferase [Deltaproteobacteria bacterium]